MLTVTALAPPASAMVNMVKSQLVRDKKVASGHAVNSVREEIQVRPFGGTIEIFAAHYVVQVSEGRGPSRKDEGGIVKKQILSWIDSRGIVPRDITKDQLAYLIARKIHRGKYQDGKGTGLIKKVTESAEFRHQIKVIRELVIKDLLDGLNAS